MLARSGAARLFRIGLAVVLLGIGIAPGESTVYASGVPNCRFGVVSVAKPVGTQVSDLGVGNYLDGGSGSWDETSAPGVDYIRVIRLSDGLYPLGPGHEVEKTALESLISTSPGEIWLIGNEPDNPSGDKLTPEVYAARYFAAANWIRQLDPTAKLGFGSITQPSPLRLRYLDRAWQALISLAGSRQAASGLVDVWSIHAFRMSEIPGLALGAGIPPGMESEPIEVYGAVSLNDVTNVYLFTNRVEVFRALMAALGEQAKPLWITSYGVWIPPTTTINNSDTAKFMVGSFGYMQNNVDKNIGMPADGSRLIQRWFWYSLNDTGDMFGGNLFDSSGKPTPIIESQFVVSTDSYQYYDVRIAGLTIRNDVYNGSGQPGTERITVHLGNSGSNGEGLAVPLRVWHDVQDPDHLIHEMSATSEVPGCGGVVDVSFTWENVQPFESHTLIVEIDPNAVPITAYFQVITGPPRILLPLVAR